jgi:hypothetical protein
VDFPSSLQDYCFPAAVKNVPGKLAVIDDLFDFLSGYLT